MEGFRRHPESSNVETRLLSPQRLLETLEDVTIAVAKLHGRDARPCRSCWCRAGASQ
jgi:hypothetical protein